MQKTLLLAIGLLGTISASIASSCPGFLFIDSYGPGIAPGLRKQLNLFVIQPEGKKKVWKKLPLQIDPFNDDGKLVFFEPDEQWLEQTIRPYDRLSMETGKFAAKFDRSMGFPCDADHIFELRTKQRGYGYLAFCRDEKNWNLQIPFHTINHLPESGEVRAPEFLYRYARDNHLLFNHLALSYDQKNSHPLVVAERADQLIRGDVKNFFTFYFDQDDIDAKIAKERRGPLGLVGSVDFYLRILFFKISLRLSPEVSFFDDSVFMPMVMHLPVDAPSYLHPGSGLFYTWQAGRDVFINRKLSQIPDIDVKKVKEGVKGLSEVGLPFCLGGDCRFKLIGEIGHRYFLLSFNIAKNLVQKGFFPLLIANADKAEEELGWKISNIRQPNRMGMYFETSGLPSGNHDWEFVIRFGDNLRDLQQECPAEITPVASFRSAEREKAAPR